MREVGEEHECDGDPRQARKWGDGVDAEIVGRGAEGSYGAGEELRGGDSGRVDQGRATGATGRGEILVRDRGSVSGGGGDGGRRRRIAGTLPIEEPGATD